MNGIDFPVEVILKRGNRRIYLRVKNQTIEITSPKRLDHSFLVHLIQKNFHSIVKIMQNQEKIEDVIHFLGDCYTLEIRKSNQQLVYLENDRMIVECSNSCLVPKLIASFYNNALKKIVENYVPEIMNRFQLSKKIIFQYKNVKTYYGECFPKRNLVILSSKLAKYPLHYILSVIYHEFAHFKYTNHQKEFYDYLESIYPNYRKIQHELRQIKYKDAF